MITKVLLPILAAASIAITAGSAEAKQRPQPKPVVCAGCDVKPATQTETAQNEVVTMSARKQRRGGLHGLVCGATQRAHYGVGSNIALKWADDFPHTTAHAGAVVVQSRHGRGGGDGYGPGHVSRIVQVVDGCHAVVADEKGQYVRDICKNLVAYVEPTAGYSRTASAGHNTRRTRYASRHRGHRYTQVAQAY